MSAEAAPDSPNRHRDLVTRFREEYALALAEADVSAEHTSTAGWQKLYADHHRHDLNRRRELAQSLKKLATQLEEVGLSEDNEKAIGDIKKNSAAHRESLAMFDSQTVAPVKQPVLNCERLIEEARRAARAEEMDHPLVNVGLEELMRAEIGKVHRAKWDDETGRVSVVAPERGGE